MIQKSGEDRFILHDDTKSYIFIFHYDEDGNLLKYRMFGSIQGNENFEPFVKDIGLFKNNKNYHLKINGTFIGSYFLISKGIADISPTLTLVSSAICFLIGLLGLSYGILSASWDFNPGSFLGFENIKPNINRMKDAFKTSQKDITS